MKTNFVTAFALLHICAFAQSDASSSPYSLRADQPEIGSRYKYPIASGSYPLSKRFEDFTSQEKSAFRAMYRGMPDTDEPPFPAAGMRRIIEVVSKLATKFRAEGDLTIIVNVTEKGDAASVKVVQTPDPDLGQEIADLLAKTKFKPAVCGGAPCQLQFPVRFRLQSD